MADDAAFMAQFNRHLEREEHDDMMKFEGAHSLMFMLTGLCQVCSLSYWFGASLLAWLVNAMQEHDFKRGVNETPVRSYDEHYDNILLLVSRIYLVMCIMIVVLLIHNVTAMRFYRRAPAHLLWRMSLIEQMTVLAFVGVFFEQLGWLCATAVHVRHFDLLYVWWYRKEPLLLPLLSERPPFYEWQQRRYREERRNAERGQRDE
jgi:hypothetical protein